MNLLRNAKVRTKLIFMAGIILALLLVISSTGYYYLQVSNDKISNMYHSKLLAIEYLKEAQANYNGSNRDLFELMVTTDNNRNDELNKALAAEKGIVQKAVKSYEDTNPDSDFEINNLKQLKDNFVAADKVTNDILSLAIANKNVEAYSLYNKNLSPISQKIEKNISNLVNSNVKEADELNSQNDVDFLRVRIIIISISAFALALGLMISIFITKIIANPIKNMAAYVDKIAQGDLSEETLKTSTSLKMYDDEIGKLGHSIIEMRKHLCELIKKVFEASEHIASSSQELNANAEESSKGTEETSNAVSTIANRIEYQVKTVICASDIIQEMSENTEQVAANAADTSKVAEKTLKATFEGGRAIDITRKQMNNIENTVTKLDNVIKVLGVRSNEIGQIVEAISAIAEQTNLLALNAAIESARAGEQGKGFAVVADEVRNLAESSQEATRKISALINEIQKDTNNAVTTMSEGTTQVKIGMEVVDKAGQAFEEISKLVQDITGQIQEIATASESIAKGSQQVVASMTTVDDINKDVSSQVQTIAASSEEQTVSMNEIAVSSEGLAKIGDGLMIEISKFKL